MSALLLSEMGTHCTSCSVPHYETYCYLQIIFYQHMEMGLVYAKARGIPLYRYTIYYTLQPTPPFSLAILQKVLKITSHFLLPGVRDVFSVLPLVLEVLNTPDHSPSLPPTALGFPDAIRTWFSSYL